MTTETNGITHAVNDHGAREGALHGVARSTHWATVRKEHLKRECQCQWCGTFQNLEVHHCIPFHMDHAMELDQSNLITLCENGDGHENCHFHHGHNGTSWSDFNPNIREQCNARKGQGKWQKL